mmetsp:Transcript_25110/g.27931  ORF Transcript_25110/g.27931 Transcript_25110/m.27931 type:complete len:191 (+) Transcript_25110:198-770(+)
MINAAQRLEKITKKAYSNRGMTNHRREEYQCFSTSDNYFQTSNSPERPVRPENVHYAEMLDYITVPATWFQRLCAGIVDIFIFYLVVICAYSRIFILISIILSAVQMYYFFWSQTYGKSLFGIFVGDSLTKTRMTFRKMAAREGIKMLCTIPLTIPFQIVACVLTTRLIHDYLVNTTVYRVSPLTRKLRS